MSYLQLPLYVPCDWSHRPSAVDYLLCFSGKNDTADVDSGHGQVVVDFFVSGSYPHATYRDYGDPPDDYLEAP